MEDDEDTDTTETSFLKTHLVRDSPALASPDLLSEVSEMKQDLIKMTAILTTDSSEKAGPMQGDYLDKGVEEVSAEPFEIMEKVKEDLEKVSEILRSGTCDKEKSTKKESHSYRKDEEWVLLTESEIEEAKMMAAFESQESLLKEVRVNRGSQRPKGARDRPGISSGEVKEYSLDAPGTSRPAPQEQQRFTEVVLRRGGRKIVPTVVKDTKAHTTEVKKPVRRKGPQGHTEENQSCGIKEDNDSKRTAKSSEGDATLLLVPGDQKKSPVSPVVEETPIGSIKEKVKALQKKVEEEQKGHKKTTSQKPPFKATEGKTSSLAKDQKTTALKKQTSSPQKQSSRSPKPEPEKLEETMSVRELMRAFQTGQDPSKRKSGLFEHKGPSKTEHETESKPEDVLKKSQRLPQAASYEEVSVDVLKPEDYHEDKDGTKTSQKMNQQQEKSGDGVVSSIESASPLTHSSMMTTISQQNLSKHGRDLQADNSTENNALDDSSDSIKHEALADSPSASLAEVEAPLSSEESYKHEGMAETPETSPESLPSPKKTSQSILAKSSKSVAVPPKVKTSKVSVSFSTEMKTTNDQASEAAIHHPALGKAVDEPSKSESMCIPHGNRGVNFGGEQTPIDKDIVSLSSKPSKYRKLTKRPSETLESFLSDDESFDGQPTPTSVDSLASRAATQDHGGLVLPLRHQDSETLSPVADDSFTISHKDSLEGSPLMEDNSSNKTPDSIEPSPTKESPCLDSLESSPIEMKTNLAFPPSIEQPSVTTGPLTSSKAPEIPPDSLRSRMLKEHEGNADDDSCEQTSLITSSGKSPLSPDTPSSEEVSYEVNPQTPDPMVLIVPFKPSVIPEETVEDDELKCGLTQRKITPEEEMFKMAAKIKTFDEMEQDAKDKKDYRKDSESSQTLVESDVGHDIIKLFGLATKHETSSVDDVGFIEPQQASEIARSVEPIIKVQPPSPFPAGIHKSPQTAEDIQQTMAHSAASSDESAMRRPKSVSEKNTIKPHLQESHSEKFKNKECVDSQLVELNKTASKSNNLAANITDEQKEQSLKRLKGSQEIYSHETPSEAANYQNIDCNLPSQKESNVTDEIKGDFLRQAGTSYVDICSGSLDMDSMPIIIGPSKETFKPEICIYDDTEEDDAEEEPPKTESRGVTAKAETDAWNSMREDDDAFAARVKEEEQKILGLVVDRHSQGATPDTTPARTPTEEGTPTSEQNPFLFQEGKLFEMTRSGAIDMTKRTYEEEGFAFYQIEQPIVEGLAEDEGSEPCGASNDVEKEVGCNLSLQIKAEENDDLSKEAADLSVHSLAVDSLATAKKSDYLSNNTSERDQTMPELVEVKSDNVVSKGHLISDPASSDIANVQTAVSTTQSLHSKQDRESSGSSPEDQHSVIEQAKTPDKTQTQSKLVSKSHTAVPLSSTTRKNMSTSKEEERPKSRIPVKASSLKSEGVELNKNKKSKLPIKPQSRRKSETDTSPPIVSLTKSSKARSFCESDSTKKPTKKDQSRPKSTDLSSTTKTLPSRLPVRGKPGQPIQTSTPAKQKKVRPTDTSKQCAAFSEEISHEAAKVVESLAQAEKEKQEADALSDDESSTIDASVIENEPFLDMQMPFPEDPLVIRPRWDNPVETQMERIPADKVRSQVDPVDEADRKEGRLTVIADHLGFSWSELARELKFTEVQIEQIRNENPNSLQDQSHALIRLWEEREGKNTTENALMTTLTKINRMDIVHLIETKIIQSSQDQSSHTYAEIEQTISLDHSEGFSALQEDMDSPRSGRRAEVTQRGSELGPLVASTEDLSCNVSSVHDSQKEWLLTDKEGSGVVGASPHSFEMVGLRQQFPGTIKQVSPFFSLYKAVPWRLQSQVYDPVYKSGTIPEESSKSIHEISTVDDPLQELGATGGQIIPVSTQQEDGPTINYMEGYKLNQRQTTLSDFGHTLLESENADQDFNELNVEIKQDSEMYSTSHVSHEKTETASTSQMYLQATNEPSLSKKKPCQSEEYIKRHVEEVSDRFYRTLFGESYASELHEKNANVANNKTPENDISSADKVTCKVSSTCVQESSDVSKNLDDLANQFKVSFTELSTEGVQNLDQSISSHLQQPGMFTAPGSGVTMMTTSALNQMSLDSFTEQPHKLLPPITDSGPSEAIIPFDLTKPTDAECTKTQYTTSISSEPVENRTQSLMCQNQLTTFSPDIEFEYDYNLTSSEYRPSSPESVESLPLDSPIPFDYRPSSPDSCILMAELRVSSPESVTSVNDSTFVDSPLPDFRPSTPLPTAFDDDTPELTIYVEEYKTFPAPAETMVPLAGLTEDTPRASYLVVSDETERPISPSSVTLCQSLSPVSNRSLSPVSICSDILDREPSTERIFESYTPSPSIFSTELRQSSPESGESINEYSVLPPESPIPCFATEFQNVSSTFMTGYRSPSFQSEDSDIDCDLISLECLVGSRPSSPESTASLNKQRCLSPDSPLPNFTQTVWECFNVFRSDSAESGLSDNSSNPILEELPESRLSSPESLTSINEYRPLSPDSPVPVYRTTFHVNVIPFGCRRDSSPEIETSDIEYSHCEPFNCEQRLESPESLVLEPEYVPLSTVVAESVTFEGAPIEETYTQNILAFEPPETLYNVEENVSELPQPKDTFMSKAMFSNRIAKVFDPQYKGKIFCSEITFSKSSEDETITSSVGKTEVLESKSPEMFQSKCKPLSFEPYNQFRPISPELLMLGDMIESNECRPLSPDTIASVHEFRPLSPDSPLTEFSGFFSHTTMPVTDDISCSPLSLCSENTKYEAFVEDQFTVENYFRESTPVSDTSMNEFKLLPPDSPVPQYFTATFEWISVNTFSKHLTGSRPSSPESLSLDFESELCQSEFIPDHRYDSPLSVISETEIRPLSPDSPVPQFVRFFSDITLPATGLRSCSPQSFCSENTENDSYLEEVQITECRPDSPDSVLSDADKRPLSPDSLPEWRPMSPESAMFLKGIRGFSPESSGSVNEYRPLSPDSPVPQYFPADYKIISVPDYRPSSPESALSDEECELIVFTLDSCPESTESLNGESPDLRSLSPDSPISQFYTFQQSKIVTGYISTSPESIVSEIDMQTDVFDDLVTDFRRSSCESVTSIDENKQLSPDSPVPEFTQGTYTFSMHLTGSRPSSPESLSLDFESESCQSEFNPDHRYDSPLSITSETEIRPLSPDSPVPQFVRFFSDITLPATGLRSCSPQSFCSENTENDSYLEEVQITEYRPDSPDSVLSDADERPLSPDSLPEWRPMSPESAMFLKDISGSSPQSNGSVNEFRPLSPDSPVPQYFSADFKSVSIPDYRSSSPESALSDEECELIVLTLDSCPESTESLNGESPDPRSLSPDSPISQFYTFQQSKIVTGYISTSPESLLSEIDVQTDVFDDLVIDFRRSSCESVTSIDENRHLSPDSPVPEFTQGTYTFSMHFTVSRPSSPESLSLDFESELCQSEFNPDHRYDSPLSITSETEIRPLSPDSPVPQFVRFFSDITLPATGLRSYSPESLCSENTENDSYLEEVQITEYRPDSPDSVLSDADERPLSPDSLPEWRPMSPESAMFLKDISGSSPQSNGSVNEFRPLSPDSPVPQYFSADFKSVSIPDYRSSSPESALSDEECELNVFTLDSCPESTESINGDSDSRSLSPDSPVSQYYTFQFEPTIITGSISTSTESILSDFHTDIFDDLIEFRRSSCESITSDNENRPLPPDSPIPDFTPATQTFTMELTGSRPTSPESVSLDIEKIMCLSDLNPEQRSDSPQSVISETEIRTDSPVPQFSTVFESIPFTNCRSSSTESIISDTDIIQSNVFDELVTDFRRVSCESITSIKENRPLSPDSPIADFTPSTHAFIIPQTESCSTSPELEYLDDEKLCQTDFSLEQRPDSPQSIISETGGIQLSSDSPLPQFSVLVPQITLPVFGHGSCSPQSLCSGTEEYEDLFGRVSSPELSEEEHELHVLTSEVYPVYMNEWGSISPDSPTPMPDSPILQYNTSYFESTMITGYGSSSPQSVLSELDLSIDVFNDLQIGVRLSSPDSMTSVNENRRLSPDSPIPEFSPPTSTFIIPELDSQSTSPVSLDVENELYQYELRTEQRPDSPESLISEIEHRALSPDSVSDYRPISPHTAMFVFDRASPESFISLEEGKPLPPDSPVPQFPCVHKISAINVFRSDSSESLTSESDIELWVFAHQTSDQRPSSPESMMSINEKRPLSPDSPIYDFKPSMCLNVTQEARYRSSSLESIVSELEIDMVDFASEDNAWAEIRALSPESEKISPVDQCNLEIEQTVDEYQQSLGQEASNTVIFLTLQKPVMASQYKLVYEAVPLALISHIYDPQYRGETFCSKPGVFMYAGSKRETFPEIKANNKSTEECHSEIPDVTSSSPLDTSSLQSHEETESFDLAISTNLFDYTSSYDCSMDNSERRASSPESYTSINEFRQLSPESPIPEWRLSLPCESLVESRPSSPDSFFSVNEFQSLSPDSPIPEYLTSSPVPNGHASESSGLMQHKSSSSPLSIALFDDERLGYPKSCSLWYPLPQWNLSENRPLSSVSDISDSESRSLSPQMFYLETEFRNPSPEASKLETELTKTATPEPFVFETFDQSESLESVITESDYEDDLSFSDTDEIQKDQSIFKNDSALVNLVTFEECTAQMDSRPETEGLQLFSEFKIEHSLDDRLPSSFNNTALEQAQKDTERVTKTITYCEKRDIPTATGESVNRETSESLVIHERDENRSMESPEERKEDLGHNSRKQTPQDSQKRENVSKDIFLEPQVKEVKESSTSTSSEPQFAASLLTSESSKESYLAPNIPEQNRFQSVLQLEAHKSTPDPSPHEPRSSVGLKEVNSFQFHIKDSHRRVELNQIDSTAFSLSPCDQNSRSAKPPSTSTWESFTGLNPISLINDTNSSDQEKLNESLEKKTARVDPVQLSSDLCAISKCEDPVPLFVDDMPKSSLAFPGTYPLVPAMTPCSLEVTQELKTSEMPIKLTGNRIQLDPTAVLDVDSPLYSLSLKARPRPIHADSTESDAEFFDCRQTFSDTSEQELGSPELLDVSQAVYQVEELPSLSSTPEYLSGIPKLREYTQLKKEDRPLSWGSEDLPIVLEPEDEYTDEVGEEKAFPYDYSGDHHFAEELPPVEEVQYDDDDDSIGREIAEELGLLSDSSEEEVLTTRVVRRRVVIQGDEMPEIPPQTVTEEQYTDEYGNMVVKKITRKVIRKFVSADGVEREEVMLEGPQQEAVTVDEADSFSKVVKRTVVRSGGDQTEVTFSEPFSYAGATASEFEEEPVEGRKVSKVVKTMVVQGERMEKLIGDPTLSSDLPSAKDDFEKALSYVGGFGKVLLPHLVEKEVVKEDGSVVRRTRMHKTRTQKRTVVKDGQSKQTHLERVEDTPDSLRADDLQQHLHQLLQRYCTPEVPEKPEPDAGRQDEQ